MLKILTLKNNKDFIIITDNINTRLALNKLQEMMTATNIYLSKYRTGSGQERRPNRMLLQNIADYITKLFKVIPYNGYFLRLSNFCGILRVFRNRRN